MTDTTDKTATEDTRPSLLEKARSAMPGLHAVETGLADVSTQLRQARAGGQPEDDVADRALAAVLHGAQVPDDLGDQIVKIRRDNETALATVQALTGLQDLLHVRRRDTHAKQADSALGVLSTELDALLSQARPVLARLGDVDSADTAITSGRVDEWRQAGQLGTRYVELRDAQRIIVAAALNPPDQPRMTSRVSPEIRDLVADFGHVRQPERHYAELGTGAANRRGDQLSETRVVDGRVVFSSHTDRPLRPRPWFTGDAIADLRFVCRAGSRAWVPSVPELTRARDEHEQRKQAEARADAERTPGDEPEPRLRTDRRQPPPPVALIDRLAREELGEPV